MWYQLQTPFTDLFDKNRTDLEIREVIRGGDLLEARRNTPSRRETRIELDADRNPHEVPYMSKDQLEVNYHLYAVLCGLDFKDVLRMDQRDIDAISVIVEGFSLPKAPAASSGTKPASR